jgi:lambda family phage portal protein
MIHDPEINALLGTLADGASASCSPLPSLLPVKAGGAQMGFPGGAYEGASQFDRELALWSASKRSADGDILPDKVEADARVRDVIRNDSLVGAGADIHKDSIIGAMFLLNAKPNLRVLGLDDMWAEEFQEEVEAKFTLMAESPNHWVDASRINTLTSMLRVDVGVYLAAGEILSTVEWLRDGPRPYNTAIQMIDVDRLSNPMGAPNSADLRGGVVRNRYGAPQGYHIRMAHPADYMINPLDSMTWKYVPARKPWGRLQVIHIFEQTRPDQTRGMSEMISALKELKIVKKFRDVVLQNAVLNATFAASIESEFPEQALAAIGGQDTVGKAITDYCNSYLAAIATYSGGAKNLVLDGIKVPHLFPGTKLQLRPAGQGGPLGSEFEQSCLRYLAANLGVSYEELSRDYSKTNYSSGKLAMGNTEKHMKARKKVVADRKASAVYALWLEEALNKGDITSMPRNAPNFYDGLNAEAYTACDWIGASKGQIDELKETQAAALRLKYNLTTLEDELARLGKDWRKVLPQRERENKEMVKRGLDPNPQDNALNAASGKVRNSDGTQDANTNDQPQERRGQQ